MKKAVNAVLMVLLFGLCGSDVFANNVKGSFSSQVLKRLLLERSLGELLFVDMDGIYGHDLFLPNPRNNPILHPQIVKVRWQESAKKNPDFRDGFRWRQQHLAFPNPVAPIQQQGFQPLPGSVLPPLLPR